MMRGMTFLPGMGLGRRQQGPSEFIVAIDHDTTFGLGFILTEADYRHMARLCKERVRACLSHTSFDATHGSLALKAYQQNLYLKYYY